MIRGHRSKAAAIVALCLAAAAGFWLRAGFGSGSRRGKHAHHAPSPRHRPTAASASRPAAVAEARAAAIRETIDGLREECRRNAGGDWDRWSEQLAPLRAELAAKIKAARPINPTATGSFEGRSAVLAGKDGFPMFEPAPDVYLIHVVKPASLGALREGGAVVDGARWLEQKGIDLLFVPIPKMTEVYPEPFLDRVPPDRIIAPHIRRAMLELLQEDVEVVDVLPTFLRERDSDAESLYQPADPHWAPRGQAIAARMVAARLARYDFAARARSEPRFCEWISAPYLKAEVGTAFPALDPEQRRRAIAAQPRTQPAVSHCTRPIHDETSPIVCIGDSYNAGFIELLAREINLPVHNLSGGGHTSHAFKDMLRDPGLLDRAHVVVWLVCDSSLKGPWPMPPKIRR